MENLKIVKKELSDANSKMLVCEKKENGKDYDYFIEGIVMQTGVVNGNGRMYELEDMKKAVEDYQINHIDKLLGYGEMRHPNLADIDHDRISHRCVNMWIEGDDVYARMKILDIPFTDVLRAMIDEGTSLACSSRCLGDLYEMDGYTLVSNFEIVGIDIVYTPSASGAILGSVVKEKDKSRHKNIVMESKQFHTKKIEDIRESKLPKQKLKYLDSLDSFM